MSYLYASNLDSLNRLDQLEIQLDNGDTAILRKGHYYDLTAGELARARRYIVLNSSTVSADERPIGVYRMVVKGNPDDGEIPVWQESEGAFTPQVVSGVSGGPYAAQAALDVVAKGSLRAADQADGNTVQWSSSAQALVRANRSFRVVTDLPYAADDTGATAANGAFSGALANVGTTYVTAGTFKLTAALTPVSGAVLEISAGATLDMSTAATATKLIQFVGTEGTTITLTADANAGGTTLTFAAGGEAGVAGDDWVRVSSDGVFDPGHTDSKIGELVQVLAPASGALTLRSPLRDTYTTAQAATFSKVTPATGTVRGRGLIKGSGAAGQHVGVYFDRTIGGYVEGVRFDGVGSNAVYFIDSLDGRIDKIRADGSNYANNGYGVGIDNACRNVRVLNSVFRDCRHATSVAASATRKGIARDIWFVNCDGYDTTGDCFDTHASCEGIHYRNCHSYDSAVCGFNMESPAASFVGCEAHRSVSHGFLMNNGSARASRYKCVANTAANCTGDSIRYSSNNTPAGAGSLIDFVLITDNVVNNPTGIGIRCSSSDTFRLKNITCDGNTVNNSANVTAAMYFNKGDGGTFTGNHVTATGAAAPGIRFNDWTTPTVGNQRVTYAANGSNSGGVYFQSVTNGTITGPAIDGAGTGIRFDNSCTGCSISDGQYPSCTTAIVPGTGTGHRFPNNTAAAESQTIATDAAFTLQARVSPKRTLFTAVMAANRAVPLSTTGSYEGDTFYVARSAASTGAFSLNVGTGPLKALATGQSASFVFTNSAWALDGFGSL